MISKENFKEALIKLLIEEYKQLCLFEDLKHKGMGLEDVMVENYDIVLDLIGFPKENTYKYDISKLNAIPIDEKTMEPVKEVYFKRDYLYEAYYNLIQSIKRKQHIEVIDTGLKMTEYVDLPLAYKKFHKFIDWLFVAFDNFEDMNND